MQYCEHFPSFETRQCNTTSIFNDLRNTSAILWAFSLIWQATMLYRTHSLIREASVQYTQHFHWFDKQQCNTISILKQACHTVWIFNHLKSTTTILPTISLVWEATVQDCEHVQWLEKQACNTVCISMIRKHICYTVIIFNDLKSNDTPCWFWIVWKTTVQYRQHSQRFEKHAWNTVYIFKDLRSNIVILCACWQTWKAKVQYWLHFQRFGKQTYNTTTIFNALKSNTAILSSFSLLWAASVQSCQQVRLFGNNNTVLSAFTMIWKTRVQYYQYRHWFEKQARMNVDIFNDLKSHNAIL